MKKDFSYLDNVSNKRYLGIGILAFFMMIGILFFSTIVNTVGFAVLLIGMFLGAIILIHWLGGVHPKDILAYQGWCQDEFKKAKKKEMNK